MNDLSGGIKGLQGVLDQLYTTMLPMCSQLITVGQGIAAFAALWFIGARVWRHIGRAEPVDVVPLLRPLAIGMAIGLFTYVIGLLNGILQPTVDATKNMVDKANVSIGVLLDQREQALKDASDYSLFGLGIEKIQDAYDNSLGLLSSDQSVDYLFSAAKAYFNFKNSIKEWMAEVLEVLYEAAALLINTLRTFNLLVLAILGPLVLGLSVFDGFHHTLSSWLARYINVFMWLPVANIFGAIIATVQVNMLALDIDQINQTGGTYFSRTDAGYLAFLVIGIIGYFSVPTVASYIVRADDNGGIGSRAGSMVISGVKKVIGLGMMAAGA